MAAQENIMWLGTISTEADISVFGKHDEDGKDGA
jgi:hypothetical protein